MKIKIIIEVENEADGLKVFDALTKLGDDGQPGEAAETEGTEVESENPFAVPSSPSWVPEDPPVIPLKTRTAIGRWCSQCKTFTEGDEAIDYIGKVTPFTCPQCGYGSHPTVTTHEVPV